MLLKYSAYAFSLIGLALSIYLTYLTISSSACPIFGGCDLIIASEYSRFYGIPIAALGILGFSFIYLSLIKKWTVAIISLGILGIFFIIYLQYLQIYVIGQICAYCTLAHILYLLTFVTSLIIIKHGS